MFEELEVVELTHNIREHKLKEGDIGTVVLVYKGGKAYEVEFVAPDGKTIVLLTLLPEDIRLYIQRTDISFRRLNIDVYAHTAAGMTFIVEAKKVLKGLETIFRFDELQINESSESKEIESYYPTYIL